MKKEHFMMTCKEAAQSISRNQDLRLPLGERIKLRMHLLFCASCRQYDRQVRWLHQTFSTVAAPWREAHLGDEFKSRLCQQMRRSEAKAGPGEGNLEGKRDATDSTSIDQ
ncbi:hypothetical protein MQE22_07060 [Acidithiobacillus sp. YTS05]|uniref:zf-HC2 domain-containing protein n=1 Tax=Igneacidithiobacillus copahuensis TaxID=2724909 RepID=UPI001C06A4E1|nr:zf-HC2 domain-containing protein [Igneacidithiobacillus copahuensis]UTV79795.1 hypothetical protein MQE22_07060 [Acidithiobacillus sp. YTS05]